MFIIYLVEPSLPRSPLLSRDAVLPKHQVHGTISILHRPDTSKLTQETSLHKHHLAMKPKGWSFLQHFLSSDNLAWAIPDISLKLVSHLRIWNWKMNALKCTDSNACLTGCHLHNWGFRGDTKWSPKWDFHPPHLRGFITSALGDLREVGFLDPVGGAQLFFHFAFRCLRGVCCLERKKRHIRKIYAVKFQASFQGGSFPWASYLDELVHAD